MLKQASIVAAALAVALPLVATSSQAAPATQAKTGSIRVTVTDAAKHPIPGWKMCPTKKIDGKTKVGHCAVTNAKGVATLTHVKKGTVYVTWFIGSTPTLGDHHKIKVKAGHTTKVAWKNA